MLRTFVNIESHQATTLAVPFGPSFASSEGQWGGESTEVVHHFDDHQAAIDAYLSRAGELIESNFVELAPWLVYRKGDEVVRVRPPISPTLERYIDGEVVHETHATVVDAVYAYNTTALALVEQGYEFELPAWESHADTLDEDFEGHTVYEDEHPDVVRKRYYTRRDAPHDEFGPELWYKAGEPYRYNFQLREEVSGPAIQSKNGVLVRGIQTFHEGENYGPTIIFVDDGRVGSLSLHTGPDGKRLNLSFEDGRIEVETADGVDAEGRLRGLWIIHGETRVEKYLDPPDQLRWQKEYDASGTLILEEHFDEHGRKTDQWLETDSENRVIQKYSAPDQLQSVTWERLDGTRELRKEFNDEEECIEIEFYSESGELTQRRIPRDDQPGWYVEEFEGSRMTSKGGIDEDGYRHGELIEFNQVGEPTISHRYHGHEVPGPVEQGWNVFTDDGRPTRALFISEYSRLQRAHSATPRADFSYDADFYDLSEETAGEDFESLAEEAVELVKSEPSRAAFLAMCKKVERAAALDADRFIVELLPNLREFVADWPNRIRLAPMLWINRMITHALPIEALHLVSALSLTAATTEHFLSNPFYPLLMKWLEDFPADGPSPEGLSLSFRDDVVVALERARDAEPHEKYHCDVHSLDQNYYIDHNDYPKILSSPLFSNVRVLDLSWQPTDLDFECDDQGILDGRGLALGTVGDSITSPHLEVLDLWGQCVEPRRQLSRNELGKSAQAGLAGLKSLNLGGGHPIGDEAVRSLGTLCPSLVELSLRPGLAGQVLEGYDFAEWPEGSGRDSVYGRLQEHWGIYGNEDIEAMRVSDEGWEELAQLPLERLTVGKMFNSTHFDGVDVETLTYYQFTDRSRIGEWTQYFEV